MNIRTLAVATAWLVVCPQTFAQGNTPPSSANPDISLILDGRFSQYDNDPDDYELPGMPLGGEAGLGEEGFALGESELVISANIDNLFFGRMTAALHDEGGETELELEEAFFETLALGGGFTLRGGRFFSGTGYLNEQHKHRWDFADAPLIYRGLFGDQLIDDGLQLRWVAPTALFLQLGGELGRGERFPAGGAANDGRGTYALFVNIGADLGDSHSWRLGLSRWSADVEDRQNGGHGHGEEEAIEEIPSFTGDSDITGINAVWKWAPRGNPTRRNLIMQFEYFQRDEDGDVVLLGADPEERTGYDGDQKGWYAQAVYQFMPQWRVGLRYDTLDIDNQGSDGEVLEEAGLDNEDHTPKRSSVMVEWSHTEFSRIRLQYNQDDAYEDSDRQLILQYTMSLGAHGAHRF